MRYAFYTFIIGLILFSQFIIMGRLEKHFGLHLHTYRKIYQLENKTAICEYIFSEEVKSCQQR